MHIDLLQEAIEGRATVVPLTVEQYHRMHALGIIEEGAPIELLDGLLTRKDRGGKEGAVTVNPQHGFVVTSLMDLAGLIKGHGCHLRIQQPITLPPDQEPEPDATIALGRPEDYVARHPGPGEVSTVIEVADTSLGRDRGAKQRIYAGAFIPQYVIVNLIDKVIEVYEDPLRDAGRYARLARIEPNGIFRLRVGDATLEVHAKTWLP